MISGGFFSKDQPDLFRPLTDLLLKHGDQYMLMADFADYIACQERVSQAYLDRPGWLRKSILNVASMGKFSTDRTIGEYAEEIWGAKPVPVKIPREVK